MSELVMVTLPRENGAANAAEKLVRHGPSGAVKLDVISSTSGQSAGRFRRDSRAACEKLFWASGEIFSKAIKPLSEER